MGKSIGDKDLTWHDWLIVSQIADINNFIPEIETATYLSYPNISPEAEVIKLDCYTKLSNEAKEVIDIVTNRPITFVKFAWNNDEKYALDQFVKQSRGIKKTPSKYYPTRLPRKQTKTLENRLTNLNIIKLFFKYKWRKSNWFVNKVIKEIGIFVEVL